MSELTGFDNSLKGEQTWPPKTINTRLFVSYGKTEEFIYEVKTPGQTEESVRNTNSDAKERKEA